MTLLQILNQQEYTNPHLIIVMGVSGCGKSTVARNIAEQFFMDFVEADDFHSASNKQIMASGIALTDELREPWIDSICNHLVSLKAKNVNVVMSYSGLRKMQREKFRHLGFKTLFLFLNGNEILIRERLTSRKDHFFSPSLLSSQFRTLQCPLTDNETDVISIDITSNLETVLNNCYRELNQT